MADLVLYIYRSSLYVISLVMILIMLSWGSLGYICTIVRKKVLLWEMANIVLAIGMVTVILYITILDRQSAKREIILIPLYSFREAIGQPEHYRSMLMNVFLFQPLGLALPFVLPQKGNKKVIISILFGLLFGVGIEITQYVLGVGRSEVDDILCNTLGCAIGTCAYLFFYRLKKWIPKEEC